MGAVAGRTQPRQVLVIGHGTLQTLAHSSPLRILQGDGRSKAVLLVAGNSIASAVEPTLRTSFSIVHDNVIIRTPSD